MSKNNIKVLPPRPLTNTETTHSLSQWRINFKQYCKKDDNFKHFLNTTTTWNFGAENAGFTENVGSRTPAALRDDLEDFLLMLASFLPHGYLTDKLISKSTSFNSALGIIEDHYGLTPSQETFCDLVGMSRLPGEPYRQFYDRMIAFVSKHLAKRAPDVKTTVDGVQIPILGDELSVSILNLVALRWLEKIHPDLLGIIRTEYSKELRENQPISSLVPRISLSVDALLAKYDKVPVVKKVEVEEVCRQSDDPEIRKINFGAKNSKKKKMEPEASFAG